MRLLKLAENLESRVEALRGKFGEIGDARLTVMAAITVCDELLDAGNRIRALEEELNTLRDVRAAAADSATKVAESILRGGVAGGKDFVAEGIRQLGALAH